MTLPAITMADEIPVAILKDSVLTFTYAEESTATASNGEEGTYKLNSGSETLGWYMFDSGRLTSPVQISK